MDRFELIVHDGNAQDFRHEDLVVVDEFFEVTHAVMDFGGERGDKYSIGRALASDPVLAAAVLSGVLVPAAYILHQLLMGFFDETGRDWKCIELIDGVIQGCDIVLDFLPIVAPFGGNGICFHHRFFDFGAGPFDLAGFGGFFHHVHFNEEIHIGHLETRHIELANEVGGMHRFLHDVSVKGPGAIDRVGEEVAVLLKVAPVPCLECIHRSENWVSTVN